MAGDYLTTNSALLRNDLQQWGLFRLPSLHQESPSATTTDGSVPHLLTADCRLALICLPTDFGQGRNYFTIGFSAMPLKTHDQRFFSFATEPLRS
jgi:hypothetical protein